MAQAKVAVVGSFAVGLTLRVDRLPAMGETLIGKDFHMGPGGKGSNQAVGAARLGAEVEFVAVIGQDFFGDVAVHLYQQEGVGVRGLRRTPDRHTGVGFIVLDRAGNNLIILDPGANELLSPQDVERAAPGLLGASVLLTQLEIGPEAALAALKVGRRLGMKTILNPAPARSLPDEAFTYADVVTPNETELRLLAGREPDSRDDIEELARRLLTRGSGAVVVTRGERGVLALTARGERWDLPAFAVPTVDTTGAGDAFNAGLAVALAEGRPLGQALPFAVACGALAVTRLGVIEALPRRGEVEDLLARSATIA